MNPLWALVPTALVGATLSGILGMGGGLLLVTVMAIVLDPIQVVPVHGAVQLVSNGTRALRLLPNVRWSWFALYTPGLFVGAALGIQLYGDTSQAWFKPFVGAFVLAMLAWERAKPKRLELPTWCFVPGGVIGGVLTVLVGATGPYLATFFLRDDLDRREVVATKAAMQVVGHFVKIPAFLSIGFDYVENLSLILPLLACAVVGTFVGTSLLSRLPEDKFRVAFRVVLALLAARLVWDGVTG